jgi:paraquat-inducible protein B
VVPSGGDLDKLMQNLVSRGLRVELQSASLLTGSKQLAMTFVPNAAPAQITKQDNTYIVPVAESGSGDISTDASALLGRLNAIPFEEIGQNLNQAIAGVNQLTNDPELKQSIDRLQSTLAATQILVSNLNKGVDPLVARMPVITTNLEDAVKRTNQLVGSVDTGYGADSQFSRQISRLLDQLTDATRSIRVLADLLTRHPEALIRGRTNEGLQ